MTNTNVKIPTLRLMTDDHIEGMLTASPSRTRWEASRNILRGFLNRPGSVNEARRSGDATTEQNQEKRVDASWVQCSGRSARCHSFVSSMRDMPEGGVCDRRQWKNRPGARSRRASRNSPESRRACTPSVPLDRGSGVPIVQILASQRPLMNPLTHHRQHSMTDLAVPALDTDRTFRLGGRRVWRSVSRNDNKPALEEVDPPEKSARARRRRQLETESAP